MDEPGMLDQLIYFADNVAATRVTLTLDKATQKILVTADQAVGVVYDIETLRNSNGGVLNDIDARLKLNKQLMKIERFTKP